MSSENPSGADNQQETLSPSVQLNPSWIAGFVDGEGCSSVSVHKQPSMYRHRGWQLQCAFQVYQHRDHVDVLEALQAFFGCGAVRPKGPNSSVMTLSVTALRSLSRVIVPFFKEEPLMVKKEDFRIFAEIVSSMVLREHQHEEGFERIARLAYGMNANGKQRARTLDEALRGSSETTRQAR